MILLGLYQVNCNNMYLSHRIVFKTYKIDKVNKIHKGSQESVIIILY